MESRECLLTTPERWFQWWMRISVVMYGVGLPVFLLLGRQLTGFLSGLPKTMVQAPPWSQSPATTEEWFWQVLGVSLMAILAVLCFFIAKDVRRYGPIIGALLAAKFTSTVCYAALFLVQCNGAYLVGAITDGTIFIVSLGLWYLAAPGSYVLDSKETRVLVAVGKTILPRGGAFSLGYADVQEQCLEDARRLLVAQPLNDIMLTRLMLRFINVLPLVCGYYRTFLRLSQKQREDFFERIEQSRFGMLRLIGVGLKLYVVVPFFNANDS